MSELSDKVKKLQWQQVIQLTGVLATPGILGPSPAKERLLSMVDFRGKRVLDCITLNGLWAFDAVRRGAGIVDAMNDPSARPIPDARLTFQLAAETQQAPVTYSEASIYNFNPLTTAKPYEVIVFFDAYHHLRHPLMAFERLAHNLEEGGHLCVHGAVLPTEGCFANFFHHVPHIGDRTTYWVPTPLCLLEWIDLVGLTVIDHFQDANDPHSYHALAVKRNRR
jgi:tRNA (mo5U34)-methyltransferase